MSDRELTDEAADCNRDCCRRMGSGDVLGEIGDGEFIWFLLFVSGFISGVAVSVLIIKYIA